MKKLTPAEITNNIVSTKYFFDELLTICVIEYKISDEKTMKFVGHSACMYAENYCQETGKQTAYKNAFEHLWLTESVKHFVIAGQEKTRSS